MQKELCVKGRKMNLVLYLNGFLLSIQMYPVFSELE